MSQSENSVKIKKGLLGIVGGICGLVPPAVFFYLLEFYTHNPWEEVRPWAQFFNLVLFELAAGFLFFLTGRLRTAYRIVGTVAMVFGIANAYVVRFRTNPIVPWDIFSWRTAANVAGNYDFTPDKRMVFVTALFLLALVLLQFVKVRFRGTAFWKRMIPAGMVLLVSGIFCHTLQQEDFQNRYRLYNKLFTPVYMTDVDGIAVTLVMNMAYMSFDKPAGYSAHEAEKILSSYENNTGDISDLPNIIVVMNESFADLSVLGDFQVNMDYLPFLHGLQQGTENTVTGMLNVSVCGGNTANTEFEFLTGNTMAFLPQGSIPYQQYIKGEIPSLAGYLRDMGYQTVGTHPYMASGWEREKVYPWLGFMDSFFLEGYAGAEKVRDYVSDSAGVQKIIELYEKKEKGKPLFLFQVTMQNHGGYEDSYPNFVPEVVADGIENTSLNNYLSLMKLSDDSLRELITYFSGADEKTVVLFFGDHQPSDVVAAPVLAKNGMAWNALDEEEMKLRYQVPYVIWANYDIEEAVDADTSANYLGAELLKRAGVPTDRYQNFLLELKEEYPVLSALRVKKGDGSETAASKEDGEMDLYRKLQYFRLFDWKGEQ